MTSTKGPSEVGSSAISSAAQDYLKTIWQLRSPLEESEGEAVSTQELAQKLGVSAPSATAMVKKLDALQLVRHEPYRGVELTPEGERVALEMLRHHRLIETFLARMLGLSGETLHREAERWEHVLSEEVEDLIDHVLDRPTHDPHGAPIPDRDLTLAPDGRERLSDLPEETRAIVRRLKGDEAVEAHLRELGVVPDTRLQVVRARPEEGLLRLRVGEESAEVVLGVFPARAVWVSREET